MGLSASAPDKCEECGTWGEGQRRHCIALAADVAGVTDLFGKNTQSDDVAGMKTGLLLTYSSMLPARVEFALVARVVRVRVV